MKCEGCNERNATFFFEQNINGHKQSRHLCHACAEKMGFFTTDHTLSEESFSPLLGSQSALIHEIFGLTGQGVKAKKCEGCGATWPELSKSGRVGCARCYKTFGAELERSIRSIHGNVTHVGKRPARSHAENNHQHLLDDLKKALHDAIESENFEEAARLRDQIRAQSDKERR